MELMFSARFVDPARIWSTMLPEIPCFSRAVFRHSRTELRVPQKVLLCQAKDAESRIDGSFSLRLVPPTLLAAEKEVKAVLTLFLKKQGLSNAVAAGTINKSDAFVDHLVSRLHLDRELTTLEIRDALIPYLETILEEYGPIMVDVVENFPDPPPVAEKLEESVVENSVSPSIPTVDSKKLKALARVSDIIPTGKLPSHIVYLVDLGMEIEAIREVIRKFPSFAYYSLEGKIKPVVEFLLDVGVPKQDIPTILRKRPQLCGISLTENLIPTMAFLEELGVDKKQWAKVIYRFPQLLTYSRRKLQSTVDFLYEMGLSAENVSKVLTCYPKIMSYSVEEKLRPTANYFQSLDVDVAPLLHRAPQLCGFSLTENLIPTMVFLEELGVDKKQWAKVIYRFPQLLTRSQQKLQSTVDFLYEMGLSAENVSKVLTRCPNIMGYSVEEKLRPTADYFRSLDVDVAPLLHRAPQTFGLSIEGNLKPVTNFFLEQGYSMEDVATMIQRNGTLYTFSLPDNMMPKWEFFLTMVYPKSELVKYPIYFGYSLEERIKPRYEIMTKCGVKLLLGQMLSLSEEDFHKVLKKKMEKKG